MLPFASLFCEQYFCQKLSKSDDVQFKAIAFNIIGVVFGGHGEIRKGGSVAEWLACWTQAQKGLGSNRSRDAVG